MTVMIDTNIILDYVLEREHFVEIAKEFMIYVIDKNHRIYLTASTVSDIYYLALRDKKDAAIAKNIISLLLDSFYISSVR